MLHIRSTSKSKSRMEKLPTKALKFQEPSKMDKSKSLSPKAKLTILLFKALSSTMALFHVHSCLISETTYEDYTQMKKNWGSHQELIKARK